MSSFIFLPPHPDLLIFSIVFLLDTILTVYQRVEFVMAESRVDRRLRFLRSGINANFTITCKDREWRVDRGVLATESEYFQKLCIGDFSEASDGKVHFPDEEPEVIDQVLVYLYTGAYDDLAVAAEPDQETPGGKITTADSNSQHNGISEQQCAETLDNHPSPSGHSEAAYIHGLSELPWVCEHEYTEIARLSSASAKRLTTMLKTGIMVYRCAKMMNLAELQSLASQRFMEKEQYFLSSDFAAVLTTLYKNTELDDKPLRLKVTDRCVRNRQVLNQYSKGSLQVLEEYEAGAWTIGVKFCELAAKSCERYEKECNDHKATREALEKQVTLKSTAVANLMATEQDLADIDYEWDRLPWNCAKCDRDMSTSRWIIQRGPNGRMQFMCRCSKKYEARQPL